MGTLYWRGNIYGVLCNPCKVQRFEAKPCHPKVVAHLNALTRTDLELPLGRHHLPIGIVSVPIFPLWILRNAITILLVIFPLIMFKINFDLCISARYVDPSIEASAVVTFNHFPSINLKIEKQLFCNVEVERWPCWHQHHSSRDPAVLETLFLATHKDAENMQTSLSLSL